MDTESKMAKMQGLPTQCWKCQHIHLYRYRVWTKQRCGEGGNIHICPVCGHDAWKLLDARTGRALVNLDAWLDQPTPDPEKYPPPVKKRRAAAVNPPQMVAATSEDGCKCPNPAACDCWRNMLDT